MSLDNRYATSIIALELAAMRLCAVHHSDTFDLFSLCAEGLMSVGSQIIRLENIRLIYKISHAI